MNRIYKYYIGDGTPGTHNVPIPTNSERLSVGFDPDGYLCAWYIVATGNPGPYQPQTFIVYYTGEECHESPANHIWSGNNGILVFHVFTR